MRRMLVLVVVLMMPCASLAATAVASAQYVQNSVATKVDTSANANQTMAGSYTVSGSFRVPTPPLPSPE